MKTEVDKKPPKIKKIQKSLPPGETKELMLPAPKETLLLEKKADTEKNISIKEEIKSEEMKAPIDKKQSLYSKELPQKVFFLTMLLVIILGLVSLFGLNHILNIDNKLKTSPFSDGAITSAPKSLRIDLEQPDDNSLVFDSSVIISGKTGPDNRVLVFTDTRDVIISAKSDGTFSTIINLDEGANRITAIVFDSTGDLRSTERTVFYSKEKI